MIFKLPDLTKILLKDMKANSDDFRKYIHVQNGHAIVQNGLVVVVNLREYVKKELALKTTEELDDLTEMLNWFENKSFDGDFWKELTTENRVTITSDENLKIEKNNYERLLVYENIFSEKHLLFEQFKSAADNPSVTIDRVSVPFTYLDKLTTLFSKELKADNLIIDFTGKERHLKISAHHKDYVFAIVPLEYNSAIEFTAFDNLNHFRSLLD